MARPTTTFRKKDRDPEAHIKADLGHEFGDEPVAGPSVGHDLPGISQDAAPALPNGASDMDKIRALMKKDILANPMTALRLRTKGPIAKDRTNISLDPETQACWRDQTLKTNKTSSMLFCENVLPWVSANLDKASLVWAKTQLLSRRRVSLRHRKAAKEGEELTSGGGVETIYYPIAMLSSVKGLWSDSGLSKKAFIEACAFLYIQSHK